VIFEQKRRDRVSCFVLERLVYDVQKLLNL